MSAGRVQSVALRLLAEREAAIEAFKPDEWWSVDAVLTDANGRPFKVLATAVSMLSPEATSAESDMHYCVVAPLSCMQASCITSSGAHICSFLVEFRQRKGWGQALQLRPVLTAFQSVTRHSQNTLCTFAM